MNKDLEVIKKKYGENMAHLCRELFPNLLDEDGKLQTVLQDNFAVSKKLYNDIKSHNYSNAFQSYLLNRANIEIDKQDTIETPYDLLKKAGYTLYECTTKAEIDRFKKYYREDEQLCTFNDNERLHRNYVFFAVRNDAADLKREDFINPEREDSYGTSVISIQFSRGKTNVTSIKNRYNTTVMNSDYTFSNDLEKIIPGLTKSFEKQYDLHIGSFESIFELSNYEFANDNRFYRYTHRIDNICYCENNIILDHDNVIRDFYMPERFIFMDNYILDLSKKECVLYKNEEPDGFVESLKGFDKVDIIKDKSTGNKTLIIKKENNSDIEIVLNKDSNIIKYKNENLINAGDNFLRHCKKLEEFNCPNLKTAGKNLLSKNQNLKEFNQPLLEEIPDGCLEYNEIIDSVNVEKATRIGDNFLNSNRRLKELNVPNAETIGRGVLEWNSKIENINIPKVKKIDSYFATKAINTKINGSNEKLDLDVDEIGDGFLSHHKTFKDIKLRNIKTVGAGFLSENNIIEKVEFPDLKYVGSSFLTENRNLKELDLSETVEIGDDFLVNNKILDKINIKNVEVVGNRFLKSNENVKNLNINNLKEYGYEFIPNNRKVKIHADSLNFKDKFYTKHVRKIKKTFEVIKNITVYNKKALNKNQELVRGFYDGQINYHNDDLTSMFDNNEYEEINKRR